MEVIIKAEPKEIAALAVELQGRRGTVESPLETVKTAFQRAIDGTAQGEQPEPRQSC